MSRLLVIRHAQASFLSADYDVLSPLGEEQARAMGESWAAAGHSVDRVCLGPRRRHRQTADAVAAAYRENGIEWPEPVLVEELDEHSGQEVVDLEVPRYLERYPELAGLPQRTPESLRRYFDLFREITRSWARAELRTPPEIESWAAFRARVTRGVESILADGERGETVFAFTSGGPVATATGRVLDLTDEKVLELSWRVRNTAYAEIVHNGTSLALNAFNAIEHLTDPRLVTYI